MRKYNILPSGWRHDGGGGEKSSECEDPERHEEGEGPEGKEGGESATSVNLLLLLLIHVNGGPGTAP